MQRVVEELGRLHDSTSLIGWSVGRSAADGPRTPMLRLCRALDEEAEARGCERLYPALPALNVRLLTTNTARRFGRSAQIPVAISLPCEYHAAPFSSFGDVLTCWSFVASGPQSSGPDVAALCPHCHQDPALPATSASCGMDVVPNSPSYDGLVPYIPGPATLGPAETLSPSAEGAPRVRRLDPCFGWYTYHGESRKFRDAVVFHPLPVFPHSLVKLRQVEADYPTELTPEFEVTLKYAVYRNSKFPFLRMFTTFIPSFTETF